MSTLRARIVPRLPARAIPGAGIAAGISNGNLNIALDYRNLAVTPIPAYADYLVAVQDPDDGSFISAPIEDLLSQAGYVESVVAGDGIAVDATDPANPFVSYAGSTVAGFGIDVDDTDPVNPVVSAIPIMAADVASTSIPAVIVAFRTSGYAAAGDGGAALYKRVVSEPSHAGKLQSADGAWWELAETTVTPQMLGATGDGVADDGAEVLATAAIGRPVQLPAGKTYLIDNSSIIPVSGQRFYGPGALKKTIVQSGYVSDFFTIDAKTNISIDGVKFSMPTGREFGVYIESSSNIRVQNCQFNDLTDVLGCTAVFIAKNSSNIRVTGNVIIKGQQGVATGGSKASGTEYGTVSEVFIQDNLFIQCQQEAIDINWDTSDFVVSGNIGVNVGDATNEAIDVGGSVDGTGPNVSRGKVYGNIMLTDGGGMNLKQWSSHVEVRSNIFINVGGLTNVFGISYSNPRDCDVHDNTFIGYGFGCNYASSAIRAHFRYNSIRGIAGTNGIQSIAGDGILYDRCSLVGNHMSGAGTGNGIDLNNFGNSDISDCEVVGFSNATNGRGVILRNTCTNMTMNNVVSRANRTGAMILAPGTQIIGGWYDANTESGLHLQAADIQICSPKVTNNVAGGGAQYQVYVDGACDRLNWNGGKVYDTRGAPLARGCTFAGPIDRAVVTGVTFYPFFSVGVSNSTNVTAPSGKTAGIFASNITA
jgi:hypothetical protein